MHCVENKLGIVVLHGENALRPENVNALLLEEFANPLVELADVHFTEGVDADVDDALVVLVLLVLVLESLGIHRVSWPVVSNP